MSTYIIDKSEELVHLLQVDLCTFSWSSPITNLEIIRDDSSQTAAG